MNLTDTYLMLEDIYDTETIINELMLVEEGRNFFDSYSFGYLACKPLRFVEDNFKPLSVYDDHEYELYMKRLKKYKAGYKERQRKRKLAYKEREQRKALKRQEILKEKEREREKRKKRKAEKERIRKETEEREKARIPILDPPEYNPSFSVLLNPTRPTKKKKKSPFEKLRKKYDSVYGKPGYEEKFLIAELECTELSYWERTKLLKAVWPEKKRFKRERS